MVPCGGASCAGGEGGGFVGFVVASCLIASAKRFHTYIYLDRELVCRGKGTPLPATGSPGFRLIGACNKSRAHTFLPFWLAWVYNGGIAPPVRLLCSLLE